MRTLADPGLYLRTEECLRFLRGLPAAAAPAPASPDPREIHHLYWQGAFGRKQAFAVKSFLATQHPAGSELWLWLDADSGYAEHAPNPLLRPLLPFLRVRAFDPRVEARDTPLEPHLYLSGDADPVARSNFFRFLILYRYGGTYADMDVMFLRDLRDLHRWLADAGLSDEFCYRWAGHPWANTAVLRLRRSGDTARALLRRCIEIGSCRPRQVLDLAAELPPDLTILPSTFFDPLWLHVDRQDRWVDAPFQRFHDFFRPPGWRIAWRRRVPSLREFAPGAFTYHWHNGWAEPERRGSPFACFEREFDALVRARQPLDAPAGWR
ncbi:MAG: glycosyltransferase [Candidatus Rokuibacteriota bacterium]